MAKPKFNPNAAYEPIEVVKPKFDPSATYEPVEEEISVAPEEDLPLMDRAKKGFEDYVVDQLPSIGAAGGGMVGGVLGATAGGVGAIPGGLAGAGIGGYLGKATQNVYNRAFRPELGPQDMTDAITQPIVSGAEGVGYEGLGALGGKAIGAIANKAGGLRNKVSSYLSEKAERAAAKALGAERGTIKKIGADKVQALGRQALDEGIVTPMASTDDLISRNEGLKERVMGERKAIYDQIDAADASTFNPLDVASYVEKEAGDFNRLSPLNSSKTKQLEDTLEAFLQRGDKSLSMNEAQALVEELGDAAKWSGVGKKTPKEELAQKVYMLARDRLNQSASDAAELTGGEFSKKALQGINQKYAAARNTDELLKNKYAREQGNKLFGLTDTIAGAGGLPAVGGPGTLGILAAKKGVERYGSQMTATGLDALAKKIATNPAAFGKYEGMLRQAVKRGPHALSSLHQMLFKDPEYQKVLEELPE